MLSRQCIFPHVIEMNVQAGHLIGCNVYLIFDQDEWVLLDIGYEESVDEIVELIRQMDFPFSHCKTLIASHADVDHIQGLGAAKQAFRGATVTAHPLSAQLLEKGDRIRTFAEITAQQIDLEMRPVAVENTVADGDVLRVGNLELEMWWAPGHTDGHIAFRMGDLLFSGDNIFRDGCVGAIDAHHGSDLAAFIESLQRIRESDVEWLLPSHGPYFRKDNALLDATIKRLKKYQHMADFGTCALDWPLLEEWEREIAEGILPE
jgi:glyoxylase-like metal-dependent hydrolase (beta-lactamase superfamily II)